MSKSQSDIAADVQKGLHKANENRQRSSTPTEEEHKATQFDGNPNPQGDTRSGVFKPNDDTPSRLKKKPG